MDLVQNPLISVSYQDNSDGSNVQNVIKGAFMYE